MSGLYLLLVVGIWVGLTWLFIWRWRRWRASENSNLRFVDILCAVMALIWLGGSFWYGGGRKIYNDVHVAQMCRQDGGIRVLEAIKLPADRFEKNGFINFYRPTKNEYALGTEYIFRKEVHYYSRGNPEVWRTRYEVLRRADGKLLGEAVSYSRVGGDLPGPWHPSSFGCPERVGDAHLLSQVFVKSM